MPAGTLSSEKKRSNELLKLLCRSLRNRSFAPLIAVKLSTPIKMPRIIRMVRPLRRVTSAIALRVETLIVLTLFPLLCLVCPSSGHTSLGMFTLDDAPIEQLNALARSGCQFWVVRDVNDRLAIMLHVLERLESLGCGTRIHIAASLVTD